jgi:hypothetical protein
MARSHTGRSHANLIPWGVRIDLGECSYSGSILAARGSFGRRGGRAGGLGIYRKGGAGGGMKGRWNWNGKCINSRIKC